MFGCSTRQLFLVLAIGCLCATTCALHAEDEYQDVEDIVKDAASQTDDSILPHLLGKSKGKSAHSKKGWFKKLIQHLKSPKIKLFQRTPPPCGSKHSTCTKLCQRVAKTASGEQQTKLRGFIERFLRSNASNPKVLDTRKYPYFLGDKVDVQILTKTGQFVGDWARGLTVSGLHLNGRVDLRYPSGALVTPALKSGIRAMHLRPSSSYSKKWAKAKKIVKPLKDKADHTPISSRCFGKQLCDTCGQSGKHICVASVSKGPSVLRCRSPDAACRKVGTPKKAQFSVKKKVAEFSHKQAWKAKHRQTIRDNQASAARAQLLAKAQRLEADAQENVTSTAAELRLQRVALKQMEKRVKQAQGHAKQANKAVRKHRDEGVPEAQKYVRSADPADYHSSDPADYHSFGD